MKIVIKIGTSTLVDKDGRINTKYVAELVKRIVRLQDKKHSVILVSSGAIGAAKGYLKLKDKPKTLREKQALAAVGQPLVMNAYSAAFKKYGKIAAQVLLTRDDFDNRTKYINVRNTLNQLSRGNIIPVVNENDTVAFEEINFGDNDTLAALVAAATDADKLFLFTDVDGLYEGNPAGGFLIRNVENITEEIESFADEKSSSGKGTGGMKTKISAAKTAVAAGVDTVIANGKKFEILEYIAQNEKDSSDSVEKILSSLNEKETLSAVKNLVKIIRLKNKENKTQEAKESFAKFEVSLLKDKKFRAEIFKNFVWHLRDDELDFVFWGANKKDMAKLKNLLAYAGTLPFTVFIAKAVRLEAKKSWIAFGKKSKGCVYVDRNAEKALKEKGKSLLAAGIISVDGAFKRGDTITVSNAETKKEFAKGLSNFDCGEILKIKGMKSSEIKKITNIDEQEVIHRDNLVIL